MVLAVANALGFDAIGVERNRKRAEKARRLTLEDVESQRDSSVDMHITDSPARKRILEESHTIAVLGASTTPHRPASTCPTTCTPTGTACFR
jgi:hypothetical protein